MLKIDKKLLKVIELKNRFIKKKKVNVQCY